MAEDQGNDMEEKQMKILGLLVVVFWESSFNFNTILKKINCLTNFPDQTTVKMFGSKIVAFWEFRRYFMKYSDNKNVIYEIEVLMLAELRFYVLRLKV